MFDDNDSMGNIHQLSNPRRRISDLEKDSRLASVGSEYTVLKFACAFAEMEVARNFCYVPEHAEWLERNMLDAAIWIPDKKLLTEIGKFIDQQLKIKPRAKRRHWNDPNYLRPEQRRYLRTVAFRKRIKYELEYMRQFFSDVPYLELKHVLGREPMVTGWKDGKYPIVPVRKITEYNYVILCPWCCNEHRHGRAADSRSCHCRLNRWGEYCGSNTPPDYILSEPDPKMLKDAPPDYWELRLAAKAKRAAQC